MLLTDPNRQQIADANVVVFIVITLIIVIVNTLDVTRDLCTNGRPVHKNKEQWLVTASKVLTVVGVTSYYIGDNLPSLLDEFSVELNCDARCVEQGLIAGVYFIFVALSTFTFLPEVFRMIHEVLDKDYDAHYIRRDPYKEYHLQYFIIRMLALLLDFDAIYTGIWVYGFVDIENCDANDIVGSTICIATGWITWSAYAIVYAHFLSNVRSLLNDIPSCKPLKAKYRVLNGFFYATVIVFFTTFFPIHILADNGEPLSCGCVDIGNTSLTAFTCEERPGVLEARIAFLFYQVTILLALGGLGAVKYSLKETKNN